MRSLTVVTDACGEVKIAQFGRFEETDEEKNTQFFINYVTNDINLKNLQKNISKIRFFKEEEGNVFYNNLFKGVKYANEYYDKFLDSSIGVRILDRADAFSQKTRLTSYYKHVKDPMFASIIFEINFQSGVAKIIKKGAVKYEYTFSPSSDCLKKKGGRPRKQK